MFVTCVYPIDLHIDPSKSKLLKFSGGYIIINYTYMDKCKFADYKINTSSEVNIGLEVKVKFGEYVNRKAT